MRILSPTQLVNYAKSPASVGTSPEFKTPQSPYPTREVPHVVSFSYY